MSFNLEGKKTKMTNQYSENHFADSGTRMQ